MSPRWKRLNENLLPAMVVMCANERRSEKVSGLPEEPDLLLAMITVTMMIVDLIIAVAADVTTTIDVSTSSGNSSGPSNAFQVTDDPVVVIIPTLHLHGAGLGLVVVLREWRKRL